MTGELENEKFEQSLTEHQRELLDRLATWVVRKRLTTPAILFLESVRPMNFVGSQIMVFFQPVMQVLFNIREWDELRLIMERRESVAYFLDLIEAKESEQMEQNRLRKSEMKEAKRKNQNKEIKK